MRNMFFFIVVFVSAVVLSSCAGALEEITPVAVAPVVPEEDKEYIQWELSHSVVEKNETTLSPDNVVNFLITIKHTYTAVYEGKLIKKDTVCVHDFSQIMDAEWRSLDLWMTKGYSATQKEATRSVNLQMVPICNRDTTVVEEGGWMICKEVAKRDHSFISTSCADDRLNIQLGHSSFWGEFHDEKLGVIELTPVIVKIKLNNVFPHHKSVEDARYDAESATWLDRPWETGTDMPSAYTCSNSEGIDCFRYPWIQSVRFTAEGFDLDETRSAEFEYWVAVGNN